MKAFYTYHYDDLTVIQTPCLWDTYQNYNYMVTDNESTILIDPGEYAPLAKTIQTLELKIENILLTHHHPDHIQACQQLALEHNCPVYGFKEDRHRLPQGTQTYQDQQKLVLLNRDWQIHHFPGHTLGLCAFYINNNKLLFCNDLLFSMGCGRVFEGTYQQMFNSLRKLRSFPDDTTLFPSHEYSLSNLNFCESVFPNAPFLKGVRQTLLNQLNNQQPTVPTTLAFEKAHNPFLLWDHSWLRSHLSLETSSDWQVFAHIRKLKDQH